MISLLIVNLDTLLARIYCWTAMCTIRRLITFCSSCNNADRDHSVNHTYRHFKQVWWVVTWAVTLLCVSEMTQKTCGCHKATIRQEISRKPTMSLSIGLAESFRFISVTFLETSECILFVLGTSVSPFNNLTATLVKTNEIMTVKLGYYQVAV